MSLLVPLFVASYVLLQAFDIDLIKPASTQKDEVSTSEIKVSEKKDEIKNEVVVEKPQEEVKIEEPKVEEKVEEPKEEVKVEEPKLEGKVEEAKEEEKVEEERLGGRKGWRLASLQPGHCLGSDHPAGLFVFGRDHPA